MKCRRFRILWFLGALCVLCGSALPAFTLDREAFTFTNYDLNVQVEPEQHRLGVRGKITLRNDSPTPQKIAVLQISSSLDWRAISVTGKAGDQPVQFVTQPYTSDIDHTGALSEAIVTLPQPVPPKGTVDLDIGYEGVILLDATRLIRIGTPEDAAKSSDWDQIGSDFTGVRGAGYVAWYPIATESANLSESNNLFEVLGRWKAREAESQIHLEIGVSKDGGSAAPGELIVSEPTCQIFHEAMGGVQHTSADCRFRPRGSVVPVFVIADLQFIERLGIELFYLHGHDSSAESYANAAEKLVPFIADWFGATREKARTVDLPDPNASPFESGALLLTPLVNADPKLAGLVAVHQMTHSAFSSPRPWIDEGLAHFAQALYLEHQKGRQAALDYMGLHRSAFVEAGKRSLPKSEDQADSSLVNTTSEELYRSKAMCVWWMLRDMIGDAALKKALAAYHAEQDNDPSYMPRLIAAQTPRDLQWFFDDWVYHDRGVPDFKIESVFPLKTSTESYLVAVTVVNLGTAGAEVPVIVKFAGGDVNKRVEVRAKSKGVIRVEVPKYPQEVVVNDGSVPESDLTNNTFKVQPAEAAK